jgi:hypothetical protein
MDNGHSLDSLLSHIWEVIDAKTAQLTKAVSEYPNGNHRMLIDSIEMWKTWAREVMVAIDLRNEVMA